MPSLGAGAVASKPSSQATWACVAFGLLFVLGAGVRFIGIWRGVIEPGVWHEADLAAVARNFYREGMNPLYPRVDWRGDGPGFAEMEFPLLPWSSAVLYHLFGVREEIGRVVAYVFSLLSLAAFFQLARYLLAPVPALASALFFVLSPMLIGHATAIQPETPMRFFYVLSVYLFLRWLDEDSSQAFWSAAVVTALATLAKLPAAHLGILFAILWLRKEGMGGALRPRAWLFALVALGPAVVWYVHAHSLYVAYGNSLGVSNEYHWVGWDLFTDPYFAIGIVRHQLVVWTKSGILLAFAALALGGHLRTVRVAIYWLASVFLYYLIISRTSADDWAAHYHIFSVPPVALLVGASVQAVVTREPHRPALRLAAVALGLGGVALCALGLWDLLPTRSDLVLRMGVTLALAGGALLLLLAASESRSGSASGRFALFHTGVWCLLVLALATTWISEARGALWRIRSQLSPHSLYLCAREMAPDLSEPGLIVASGTSARDAKGYPVAYHAPYMFYWLDRKGFVIATEQQSVEALQDFARRGARYFVAEKPRLDERPGFAEELRTQLGVVFECEDALVFELSPRRGASPRPTAHAGIEPEAATQAPTGTRVTDSAASGTGRIGRRGS
jgi:4-amino-4-deoxy-L-arabinose transferase-like glycosyltransferase